MTTENLNINYKAQIKTWPNPQIKNHKQNNELRLIDRRQDSNIQDTCI